MAVESRVTPATLTFASLLRQHRITAALSQEALAERAGLSVRAISDLERGVKTRPYLETVRMLADALGLSAEARAELATSARQDPGSTSSSTTGPDRVVLPAGFPTLPSTLLGRDSDVDNVISLLTRDDVRMVTLTGPGGVGKTSLAIQAAPTCCSQYEGGCAFVSLAAVRDPDSICYPILQALESQESPERSLVDQIVEAIGGRPTLLVLDNFEQVVSAAPIVATLIERCRGLRILATSRTPLRIRAEHEYPVRPLAVPLISQQLALPELEASPAIALFVDRCRAISPDFRLNEEHAASVAEICRRLDGLPLAIELVAAWTKILTPPAILARMERRTRWSNHSAKDLPDRHRTLERCVEWSYDLLSPDAQSIFRQLSVFDGGCSLEAAEAVCEQTSDVIDGLYLLNDSSLIFVAPQTSGTSRFVMLETIREFALEKLISHQETNERRSAHASFFARMAVEAESHFSDPDQAVWMDALETDHDNLRAALAWFIEGDDPGNATRLAGSLWQFWYTRGYLSEGRRWLMASLEVPGDSEPAERAKALTGAGVLSHYLGDHEVARAFHHRALEIFSELGDLHNLAFSLVCLGSIDAHEGKYERAAASFNESLEIQRAIGNPRGISLSTSWLAEVAANSGDLDTAGTLFDETLAICRTLADPYYLGSALVNRGEIHQLSGNLSEATPYFNEAFTLFRSLGDRRSMAATLTNLGRNCILLGKLDDARAVLRESGRICHEIGDGLLIANCADQFVGLYVATGEFDRAVRVLAATDRLRASLHAPRPVAYQELRDQRLDIARDSLDPDVFEELLAEGFYLSRDRLLDEILDEGIKRAASATAAAGDHHRGSEQHAALHISEHPGGFDRS